MAERCPFHLPGPYDPEYVQDPYPYLARAREEAPVSYLEQLDLWLVSRYEDVRRVLQDPQTYSNANVQKSVFPLCAEAIQVLKAGKFDPAPTTVADPPLHTRIRKHFSKALSFTPERIVGLRPWIQNQASLLIDGFAARGHADLHAELTAPLPARVIFHLVGFPEQDTEQLTRWSMTRLKMSFGVVEPAQQVATASDMVNYWKYCVNFVEQSRGEPANNVTTTLLQIHERDPDAITIKEITSFLYGLIVAGHETTNHAMASTIQLLLKNRERWEALLADRSLVPNAFEEGLRLEPPIAAWRRVTTCDTELGGVSLPKGTELLLHLGSAGHDAELFENGEEFKLGRNNVKAHLAYGNGIHFCLGAPLARLEGEIVLNLLLDRLPALRLVEGQDYGYLANLVIRGPTQLLVEWGRNS